MYLCVIYHYISCEFSKSYAHDVLMHTHQHSGDAVAARMHSYDRRYRRFTAAVERSKTVYTRVSSMCTSGSEVYAS